MPLTDCGSQRFLQPLERIRYVNGLLLGVDDFQTEQDYFRKRLRRHNVLMHGWGIVFGLEASAHSEPGRVMVEPGYAIDQQGEEIVVDRPQIADVSSSARNAEHHLLYPAVRYRAKPSSLVPAPGTEGDALQYSRWIDSFELALLEQRPAWDENTAEQLDPESGPWIVLGCISTDTHGKVTVRHCPHRRTLRRD